MSVRIGPAPYLLCALMAGATHSRPALAIACERPARREQKAFPVRFDTL